MATFERPAPQGTKGNRIEISQISHFSQYCVAKTTLEHMQNRKAAECSGNIMVRVTDAPKQAR